MDRNDAIDEMLAERAITKVIFDYCQGADRRDWDLVRACYHDDAQDSHGAFVGRPDELVDWLQNRHQHLPSSTHVVTNVSIRFREGREQARVESYILSLQIVDPSGGDSFAGDIEGQVFTRIMARYVDTFQLRPGIGWRIQQRTVAYDWMLPPVPANFAALDPAWTKSQRDKSDVLYAPWPESDVINKEE
ncbi:hypothetical protein GCM10022381_30180 [Leifsonia kafniensis]|uniref:SnoaL-like domain-containing protein n=1 Tax=Leifsonia kafniensis TaxID=475957 RepID=A0ABP7KUE3_9MICO